MSSGGSSSHRALTARNRAIASTIASTTAAIVAADAEAAERASGAAPAHVCASCREYDVGIGCEAGHPLCAHCDALSRALYDKWFGPTDVPASCPVAGCTARLRAAAPAGGGPAAPRLARLVRLEPADPEYVRVVGKFLESMPNTRPRRVYRVDNPALRGIHEACRARMDKEGRWVGGKNVGANARPLVFHGTTRAAAGGIIAQGFDIHRAGSSHGQAAGHGIYVGASAAVASGYAKLDEAGLMVMVACSALLGDTNRRDSYDGQSFYVIHREQQLLPLVVIYYDVV